MRNSASSASNNSASSVSNKDGCSSKVSNSNSSCITHLAFQEKLIGYESTFAERIDHTFLKGLSARRRGPGSGRKLTRASVIDLFVGGHCNSICDSCAAMRSSSSKEG